MPSEFPFGRPSNAERASSAILDGLNAEVGRELIVQGSRHHVGRGEVLYGQGDLLDRLFVVESGSFKIVRQSDEGKELIVGLAGGGDVFGALSEKAPAENVVQALQLATCLSFPVQSVRKAIDREPELALRLLRYVEKAHYRAQDFAAQVVFDSVPKRLAALILSTSEPRTGHLRYPLTQTEIANIIGSSRETVCSILNRFQRQGAVSLSRGRIRLLDRDRLM